MSASELAGTVSERLLRPLQRERLSPFAQALGQTGSAFAPYEEDLRDISPMWLPRAELLERLAALEDPRIAGRDVWQQAEAWVSALKELAQGPEVLLAEVADWTALLDRHSTVEFETRHGKVEITWENVHGHDPDAGECALRHGALESLLAHPSGNAEVDHTECRARGDAHCVFTVADLTAEVSEPHARALREASVLSGALSGREHLFRRLARVADEASVPDLRSLGAAIIPRGVTIDSGSCGRGQWRTYWLLTARTIFDCC